MSINPTKGSGWKAAAWQSAVALIRTVRTRDRKLSAQWEHTIGVTDTGCEVFTRRKNEPI